MYVLLEYTLRLVVYESVIALMALVKEILIAVVFIEKSLNLRYWHTYVYSNNNVYYICTSEVMFRRYVTVWQLKG